MSQSKAAVDVGPENEQLLAQLEELLTTQIQSAQHNDFSAVIEASRKADEVVGSIVCLKLLEKEEYRYQRRRIEKLYRALSGIINVEKIHTTEQLTQLHAGSRLLIAYKNNT